MNKSMLEKGVTPHFNVPKKTDVAAILAIMLSGSPKLRALIRILAELVVLKKKKIILWSSLPATQILIHRIC